MRSHDIIPVPREGYEPIPYMQRKTYNNDSPFTTKCNCHPDDGTMGPAWEGYVMAMGSGHHRSGFKTPKKGYPSVKVVMTCGTCLHHWDTRGAGTTIWKMMGLPDRAYDQGEEFRRYTWRHGRLYKPCPVCLSAGIVIEEGEKRTCTGPGCDRGLLPLEEGDLNP